MCTSGLWKFEKKEKEKKKEKTPSPPPNPQVVLLKIILFSLLIDFRTDRNIFWALPYFLSYLTLSTIKLQELLSFALCSMVLEDLMVE